MPALRIAIRYLLARKSHTAVNVISYISMAGIAVAAMAMICVLSVFNGFSDLASDRLSLVDPDVKITRADGKIIMSADSLARAVESSAGVARAVPTLSAQALAVFGDVQSPVNVVGVPADYGRVSEIGSLVIDGEMDLSADHRLPGALLSIGTAMQLGARPSSEHTMLLTVPRRLGRINPAFPLAAFCTDTLFVSGVYQTNQAELDNDMIFIPLESARRLLDYSEEASAIEIGLEPGAEADAVVKTLGETLGSDYVVADRLRQQSHSFRMISIEKWITFLMLVFVLLMASFNILSSLSMLIIEKEESLRILSSLGAPLGMIRRIFLYQGTLVAVTGGVIGILTGVILCLLQQHYGLITLGGDHSQMSIVTYPCNLRIGDVLVTSVVVLVMGLLSGLISSRGVRSVSLRMA